jgi:rhodanese-related sulfurtransferase
LEQFYPSILHHKRAQQNLAALFWCDTGVASPAGSYNSSMTDSIKSKAQERGRARNLSYAGALVPAEAYALMLEGAKLVDVRTIAELHFVGAVPGSEAIEWNSYPEGMRNPVFREQLAKVVRKDEPVMFLCRSGVRSHHAATAAMEAGWSEAYNILEGFEGDKNAAGQRNTINGWKVARLPWVQS